MRRRKLCAGRSVAPDHQMAVADTVVEFDAVAGERSTQVRDDLRRLFAADVSGGEVLHHCAIDAVSERHQVHAECEVTRSHRDSHAGRFDWRASRVIFRRIVPQHRHRADVASGWHPGGNRRDAAEFATRRDRIHMGLARRLKRRASPKLVARPVGHPVPMDDYVLHNHRLRARCGYSRSRIFITLSSSGSTTMVLLRFLSAVSGSLSPWPVSVQTITDPGLMPPAAPNLSAPATDAAEAGSAKMPPAAMSR